MDNEDIVSEQLAYYRARAKEYDEWFFRRGRYDRGTELNSRWRRQVHEVEEALEAFAPTGRVLELACGTGLWTLRLAARVESVTAVDAAPEMLRIARARAACAKVRFVRADLFRWRPEEQFDVVFFAFWLSHVPEDRFEAFWELVGEALRPGGRVFFVDSLRTETSTASDHRLGAPGTGIATRKLNDGRAFRVVKVFHDPAALARRLRQRGWDITALRTQDYFLHGRGGRAAAPPGSGSGGRSSG